MKLFAGNSHLPLAKVVAEHLKISLAKSVIRYHSNREIYVEIDENVRGEEVFVLQSMSYPTNDFLMEMLIMVDALKRAGAQSITCVVPYYGYARQDRKLAPRSSLSAKLVANLFAAAGVDKIITLDLHSPQIEGFFRMPLSHLSMATFFAEEIKQHFKAEDVVVVSPDMGGVLRARSLADMLEVDLVILDKKRDLNGLIKIASIKGDVAGKTCIILDDMVDSADTLCGAAQALKEAGASSVVAYVTHGIFSNGSIEKIEASCLSSVTVSDSVLLDNIKSCDKIKVISIASMIAEEINKTSVQHKVFQVFERD